MGRESLKTALTLTLLLAALVRPACSAELALFSGITEATVQRVVDGDTVVLHGGERVRFIGVDAPETGEPGAAEASEFVRRLIEGETVWLEADGADRERFARLRRYVWLRPPTDTGDEEQIRRYQLNALLLSAGHARVMIIGSPRNAELFRRIEAEAGSP